MRPQRAWLVGGTLAIFAAGGCSEESSSDNPGVGGTTPDTCPVGQAPCDGICVNIAADRNNCGTCGTTCGPTQQCLEGVCQCSAGLLACREGCVNPSSSGANCGACDNACPDTQVCSRGVCQENCGVGEVQCGQDCAATATDLVNCGGCGITCTGGRQCESGLCVCSGGQLFCNNGCVDPLRDNLHCGECGITCTGGATCSAGVCVGGTGGAGTGGAGTGGAGTGGMITGGMGGMGGHPAGGTAIGGGDTGGATTGGTETGGESAGGTTTGGQNTHVPFILGADISNTQESNARYRDTDGVEKSIFDLLKNHGFNYIRLRTFVDPMAPYGYASSANGCSGLSEAYGDKAHVIEYGKRVKDAGMGFLLDFHYSDVWADPGNQIIPEAWRGAANIEELASLLKAYTTDVIADAIAAGARPDMVQVGNEITPGMLVHLPGPNTDCWGNNPVSAPFGGSSNNSNWGNLATLLKAGIEGVREVDPTIEIVLHIESPDAASWWVGEAVSRDVDFDILGLSCYTAFQGPPSAWQSAFEGLANDSRFDHLDFIIAEYNPERTSANLIMKNLPEGRGRGAFFWEPTASGEWGQAMFTWSGGVAVANQADFQEYDNLLPQLGL